MLIPVEVDITMLEVFELGILMLILELGMLMLMLILELDMLILEGCKPVLELDIVILAISMLLWVELVSAVVLEEGILIPDILILIPDILIPDMLIPAMLIPDMLIPDILITQGIKCLVVNSTSNCVLPHASSHSSIRFAFLFLYFYLCSICSTTVLSKCSPRFH